ncbi:uncharacterized protein TNCV_3033581 [Trichonephila clavipes]|nr:uncharacterized protein TNCV_3033581 [Trichonephila clavipes]
MALFNERENKNIFLDRISSFSTCSNTLSFDLRSLAVGSLVVRASDSRPEGLGSMLDVTQYPPSAHGFTCRNCGGGDRGRVAIYRPFGEVSLSLNRTVTCMVLKANDRRTSYPCHDEFRGPRSDYVRQKWETPAHPQCAVPQSWGGTEPKRTVPYMLLKATTNVRRTFSRLQQQHFVLNEQ